MPDELHLQVIVLNTWIWLVWLLYWHTRLRGRMLDESKLPTNSLIILLLGPLSFILGYGLTAHGKRIRKMVGIGIVGMFGVPLIIGLWLSVLSQ